MKGHPIGHKNMVSQDRWLMVTGSFTLKCVTFCQELSGLSRQVLYQHRFHCTATVLHCDKCNNNTMIPLLVFSQIDLNMWYSHREYYIFSLSFQVGKNKSLSRLPGNMKSTVTRPSRHSLTTSNWQCLVSVTYFCCCCFLSKHCGYKRCQTKSWQMIQKRLKDLQFWNTGTVFHSVKEQSLERTPL